MHAEHVLWRGVVKTMCSTSMNHNYTFLLGRNVGILGVVCLLISCSACSSDSSPSSNPLRLVQCETWQPFDFLSVPPFCRSSYLFFELLGKIEGRDTCIFP